MIKVFNVYLKTCPNSFNLVTDTRPCVYKSLMPQALPTQRAGTQSTTHMERYVAQQIRAQLVVARPTILLARHVKIGTREVGIKL